MKSHDRVIVPLLTAIAVLLAINLFASSDAAKAQDGYLGRAAEPTVVAGAVTQVMQDSSGGQPYWRAFRIWSDGSVDGTIMRYNNFYECTPDEICTDVILAGVCPADVDQTGFVDVSDLLDVLTEWGPCE